MAIECVGVNGLIFAFSKNWRIDWGIPVEKPVEVALPYVSHGPVVRVAQANFKYGDVLEELSSKVDVPLVEFKSLLEITVACLQIRFKPGLREAAQYPGFITLIEVFKKGFYGDLLLSLFPNGPKCIE